MERALPDWLNADFLSTVIQGGENADSKVVVLNFTPSLAVAPGNNYLSYMFRVKVEFQVKGSQEVKSISLMVKAPFTKGLITEIKSLDVFGVESLMYTKVLPMMKEKLQVDFGPQSFYCPVKGVILKDLKEDGYVMCDRIKQLDFAHSEIAIRTLARFHAASVACYHDNPELVSSFREGFLIEGSCEDTFGLWYKNTFTTAGTIIKGMGNFQRVTDYLISNSDNILRYIVKMLQPKKQGLNVLNHGDCWTNNMLFKYNKSGDAVDVKFIDFQLSKYGSPVIDLLYFLWTSPTPEVHDQQDTLVKVYLETLNGTLEELQCEERLGEEELLNDLHTSTLYILHVVFFYLPYILGDPDNPIKLDELSKDDYKNQSKAEEMCWKKLSGKYYKAAFPDIVRMLNNWLVKIHNI